MGEPNELVSQGHDLTHTTSAERRAEEALHPPEQRHSALRLGEVLVDLGFTDASNVEAAVNRAANFGLLTGKALIENGAVTGRQLARALASSYGLPFLDYDEFPVDDQVLVRVNTESARRHMAIPCARLDDGTVIVAVSDPKLAAEINAKKSSQQGKVIYALAQENDVYFMIKRAEQLQAASKAS